MTIEAARARRAALSRNASIAASVSPYFRLSRVRASRRSSIASSRPGVIAEALAESADRRERVLDLRAGAVERVGRRGERRVESRRAHAGGAPRARSRLDRRALVVVEQRRRPRRARRASRSACWSRRRSVRSSSSSPARRRAPSSSRDLKAQEILALGRDRARPPARARASSPARRGAWRSRSPTAIAQLFGVRESVEEVELASRLEEALVLVLAVDLDELVAEPLEQPDRHRRVVDEGAVASGASELPPHDELAVVQAEPGVVEHRRDRAARRRRRTPPPRWRSRCRCG